MLFVLIWVALVIFTFDKNRELTSPDYYSQEMQYQQRIESSARSKKLNDRVNFNIDESGNSASIHFPNEFQPEAVSGTIELFRPSDTHLDVKLPILLNNDRHQSIDISTLKSGFWRIKIDWQADSTAYYDEFSFTK